MKISESVDLIDGTMANCYSIKLRDRVILVDAGMKGSGKKCIEFYRQAGYRPDTIIITHYHPDHIGGLKLLSDEFHPEIYVPDEERAVIEGQSKPVPGKSMMSRIVGSLARSVPVSNVKGASELSIDGIEVLPTPGHTPGSTSYFLKSDGVIFVGDAIVTSSGEPSINRGFTLDYEMAQKSMKEIMSHPCKIILSGHGKPYHKGKETGEEEKT